MSNCNQSPVAIPIAAIGAGLGALQQSKIDRALSGDKVYTKPKTIFGKLIGGVSGRSAAAEASAGVKTAPLSSNVMNSLQPSTKSTPVSGGFQFGGEATRKTYLPFYLGAIVLGIFFFMRRKGGRRRR